MMSEDWKRPRGAWALPVDDQPTPDIWFADYGKTPWVTWTTTFRGAFQPLWSGFFF